MSTNNRPLLARKIRAASHITGDFMLRSGQTSHEYFDKYLFEARPELLKSIAEHMAPMIPTGTDVLAGLEMGGIPVVTMLSQMSGIPALFVRKKAKIYGTAKLAEGGDIDGKRLLVVEDVVTTGGQIILSTEDLRALGASVCDVVCVIDREAGGAETLARAGLRLHPLFTISELKTMDKA